MIFAPVLLYWHEPPVFPPSAIPLRHRIGFIAAKVGNRACTLRFEVHFLQILPCRARVIGKKKHRVRLLR
jgi:hypothetical protein